MAKRSSGLSVVSRLNIVHGWSKTGRSEALSEVARAAFQRARVQLLAHDAKSGVHTSAQKRTTSRARARGKDVAAR